MARLRFALRSLGKAPLLSIVVVVSLGLGIGANTAIFSLLHQLVLRSLPVQKPEELVLVTAPGSSSRGGAARTTRRHGSHLQLPCVSGPGEELAGDGGAGGVPAPRSKHFLRKTDRFGRFFGRFGQYFTVVGGKSAHRTDARAGDDGPRAAAMPWRCSATATGTTSSAPIRTCSTSRCGSTPRASRWSACCRRGSPGRPLAKSPTFMCRFRSKPQLTPNWNGTDRYNDYWLYLVGRLKPGTTREQAAAALNSTYRSVVEEHAKTVKLRDPKRVERYRVPAQRGGGKTGKQRQSRHPADGALILMAATVLVLLIAMANAANLLLARSAQRKREMAIRAAMGASRGELMAQLLTEALLLAAAGGIAGILPRGGHAASC